MENSSKHYRQTLNSLTKYTKFNPNNPFGVRVNFFSLLYTRATNQIL